jgi:secreted trypsin-like serine protease
VPETVCRETQSFRRVEFGKEHLCAGGELGKDSCKGDSGGPLVVPGLNNFRSVSFLIGVVSFGTPYCGLVEAPGVYTRVATYLPWIKENVVP